MIRIANGQGFWGDWLEAPVRLIEQGPIVQALFSAEIERLKASAQPFPEDLQESIEKTRADYERWLDSKYAAARGHVDAIIDPMESREVLSLALEVAIRRPRGTPLAEETV